jgi:hypothetical protein
MARKVQPKGLVEKWFDLTHFIFDQLEFVFIRVILLILFVFMLVKLVALEWQH